MKKRFLRIILSSIVCLALSVMVLTVSACSVSKSGSGMQRMGAAVTDLAEN